MNLGRANQRSQCVLPKESLSLFLCSKEAAHFVHCLTRGPCLNQGQSQTAERGEKVLTSLQISGKLMAAESSEIATVRKK